MELALIRLFGSSNGLLWAAFSYRPRMRKARHAVLPKVLSTGSDGRPRCCLSHSQLVREELSIHHGCRAQTLAAGAGELGSVLSVRSEEQRMSSAESHAGSA